MSKQSMAMAETVAQSSDGLLFPNSRKRVKTLPSADEVMSVASERSSGELRQYGQYGPRSGKQITVIPTPSTNMQFIVHQPTLWENKPFLLMALVNIAVVGTLIGRYIAFSF